MRTLFFVLAMMICLHQHQFYVFLMEQCSETSIKAQFIFLWRKISQYFQKLSKRFLRSNDKSLLLFSFFNFFFLFLVFTYLWSKTGARCYVRVRCYETPHNYFTFHPHQLTMRNSPFKNVQVRNYWLVTSHHDFKCNYVLINCDKSAFSDFTIYRCTLK